MSASSELSPATAVNYRTDGAVDIRIGDNRFHLKSIQEIADADRPSPTACQIPLYFYRRYFETNDFLTTEKAEEVGDCETLVWERINDVIEVTAKRAGSAVTRKYSKPRPIFIGIDAGDTVPRIECTICREFTVEPFRCEVDPKDYYVGDYIPMDVFPEHTAPPPLEQHLICRKCLEQIPGEEPYDTVRCGQNPKDHVFKRSRPQELTIEACHKISNYYVFCKTCRMFGNTFSFAAHSCGQSTAHETTAVAVRTTSVRKYQALTASLRDTAVEIARRWAQHYNNYETLRNAVHSGDEVVIPGFSPGCDAMECPHIKTIATQSQRNEALTQENCELKDRIIALENQLRDQTSTTPPQSSGSGLNEIVIKALNQTNELLTQELAKEKRINAKLASEINIPLDGLQTEVEAHQRRHFIPPEPVVEDLRREISRLKARLARCDENTIPIVIYGKTSLTTTTLPETRDPKESVIIHIHLGTGYTQQFVTQRAITLAQFRARLVATLPDMQSKLRDYRLYAFKAVSFDNFRNWDNTPLRDFLPKGALVHLYLLPKPNIISAQTIDAQEFTAGLNRDYPRADNSIDFEEMPEIMPILPTLTITRAPPIVSPLFAPPPAAAPPPKDTAIEVDVPEGVPPLEGECGLRGGQ